MRYFSEISYNGVNYHGWQIQPNANTVQAEIEKAFGILFRKEPFKCIGCGRTDTEVHASQFFFHFDTNEDFDPELYSYKLNSILPKDIAVHRIFKVGDNAHARFDATSRTYKYLIHDSKNVFLQKTSFFFPSALNLDKMNEACRELLLQDDFTSFSKLHTDAKTNICNVVFAEWRKKDNNIVFEIKANRFLRNMVRAIVGTLLEVGMGNLSVQDFKDVILAKDRGKAGRSVPGYGLYLAKVEYPFL